MNKTIRIGTRRSKLALWQAEHVANLIHPSGYRTEIVPIDTTGDKVLDVSISKIGSKGVFTEEIEARLLDHSVDIAVHSAKDLSSELPDDLELIAFTEREKPNDVIVSLNKSFDIRQGTPRIGTSSTRRVAFLHHFYPHATALPVRGNLQTRISKMSEGDCDALMLAYAGVKRMGYEDMIVDTIETSYFVPAVGQGSIAVECHRKLSFDKKEVIQRWVNHPESETCIHAERAFLKTLQGGCSIPAFGYAHFEGPLITLKAGIISLDGTRVTKIKKSGLPEQTRELGDQVAREVLATGGREILEQIRSGLQSQEK